MHAYIRTYIHTYKVCVYDGWIQQEIDTHVHAIAPPPRSLVSYMYIHTYTYSVFVCV